MGSEIYADGTYLRNNPDWHSSDSRWKAEQIVSMLRRNSLPISSICEVGCGAGEILLEISRRLPNVNCEGYDVSADAYNLCVAKETDRVRFFHGDLLETDRYFDLVLAIDVFEHVEDYLGFLRKLRSKGKYKMFHIPLELSWLMLARSNSLIDMRKSVGHIHHFSKETALATLRDAGYTVLDCSYTSALNSGLYDLTWKQKVVAQQRKALARVAPDAAARILGGYSLLVLAE